LTKNRWALRVCLVWILRKLWTLVACGGMLLSTLVKFQRAATKQALSARKRKKLDNFLSALREGMKLWFLDYFPKNSTKKHEVALIQ